MRNILNLMRGLLAQSRNTSSTLEEFTDNLDGRIQALARAHDQLTSEQWEPSSLKALIECEFDAYAGSESRVVIEGPEVMVDAKAFTTLALVLHEMATNSIKYGALSSLSGVVHVNLAQDRNGGILMDWIERGGPPVIPPKRRGFGTMIIEGSIPHELRGNAEISYRVTGLEAHFRLPAQVIHSVVENAPATQTAAPAPVQTAMPERLEGRGLVLEDALIIAMDAAGILEDLGASHVEIVSSVAGALKWVENNDLDFAVLDVNLGSEQSLPVAELLHRKGVPFVLATGYGSGDDLTSVYPPCKIVQKPFSGSSLKVAMFEAILQAGHR